MSRDNKSPKWVELDPQSLTTRFDPKVQSPKMLLPIDPRPEATRHRQGPNIKKNKHIKHSGFGPFGAARIRWMHSQVNTTSNIFDSLECKNQSRLWISAVLISTGRTKGRATAYWKHFKLPQARTLGMVY